MSPNAPMWMKVMRELLHNAKIVLTPDQLAVTSLAAEMSTLQVDPMTTVADTSHTIFRPSETNPAKACHPTPYAERLWQCIAQICKEQKKQQPDNIFRPGATATLLEWEEYILQNRPELLSSSRIPKINTSATLTAAEARKQSLRPNTATETPAIHQLPTPGSNIIFSDQVKHCLIRTNSFSTTWFNWNSETHYQLLWNRKLISIRRWKIASLYQSRTNTRIFTLWSLWPLWL